ncbi:hypothetical protein NDU88_001106 [Pleurodeles waltl]|uniref:Uncharacterized protein n=1 Tax=Pleurodeles waltl TaxID=8319 RepID=A0AAV7LC48_PLEWA|nr:hypothetical protein NDU88_001106 [Pleurodeles waltl]
MARRPEEAATAGRPGAQTGGEERGGGTGTKYTAALVDVLGTCTDPEDLVTLTYRDRDITLQAARDLNPITVDNTRISLYPDYTLMVQKCRACFQVVKRRLRTEGLKYALLFPARLRVTFNQKTHFFETPDSACDWLDATFPHLGNEERSDALPPRQPHQSRRSGRGRMQSARKKTGPTMLQVLEGRNEALQSAYSLQGTDSSPHGPPSSIDSATAFESEGSSALFPAVTPQSAQKP